MNRNHAQNSTQAKALRFNRLIGTGGIGTGMFFLLEGNQTLGRNESRAAKLVPFKDYCKLHIISHYVAVLMGSQNSNGFHVWPIGKVGNDEPGLRLIDEMELAGIKTRFIEKVTEPTMISICFQYPDSTGGNITASNSACEHLTPDDILKAKNFLQEDGAHTLILAAPEVPILSRIELLHAGREVGAFNTASLLSSEVGVFRSLGGFTLVDYVSINIDEAAAIVELDDRLQDSQELANICVSKLQSISSRIMVTITDGPNGAYGFDGTRFRWIPPIQVQAVGTGGAGDAFFAGVLVGFAHGLSLLKENQDSTFGETPLDSASELGTLIASLSVTSPDTIHQTLDLERVRKHIEHGGIIVTQRFHTALYG